MPSAVDTVGGDDVVVGDVEGEGEVVAAPAYDIDRIVLVIRRRWAALVDQPDLVLVALVIFNRGRLGDGGLRRIEREVAAERAGRRYPELVAGFDHQQRGLAIRHLAPRARLRDVDPVALPVAQ